MAKHIQNVSSHKLSFFQKLVLCRGLKFSLPQHVCAIDIQVSFKKFYWKLERTLADDKKELTAVTLRSIALNCIECKSPKLPKPFQRLYSNWNNITTSSSRSRIKALVWSSWANLTHVTHVMAGHMSHIKEPSIWPCSPQVSHSSEVRACNWYLEGHGFDSRWGLRKFFFWVFRLENASSLFTLYPSHQSIYHTCIFKSDYVNLLSQASINDTPKFTPVSLQRPTMRGQPVKHYHPLLQKEKHLESVVQKI